VFWGIEEGSRLFGIMGIQDKGKVTLIRHAYVLTNRQNYGIGTPIASASRGNDKEADFNRHMGRSNMGPFGFMKKTDIACCLE